MAMVAPEALSPATISSCGIESNAFRISRLNTAIFWPLEESLATFSLVWMMASSVRRPFLYANRLLGRIGSILSAICCEKRQVSTILEMQLTMPIFLYVK